MIKTPRVPMPPSLEIRTGKTGVQLFKEVLSKVLAAVGQGYEPALQGLLPMCRAKEFRTGQIFPAWLLLAAPVFLRRDA